MSNTGIRQIYSVSILTKEIKSLLEDKYPFVWIMGEISNFACPASGHSYFSLKDENAVINCVMFRNQKLSLKFEPENGMTIVGLARLSLYEPRGSYQLIFEHMEPEGVGANQVAFEQLKRKLEQEGLFKPEHKKLIPFLPSVINVITSATGAAVKDIINISKRRFANCRLEIVPVQVQGEGAELQICQAIDMVNEHKRSDVIILARGGGSMEDLTAFNSENVARAIFNSRIPVITGIGHETDFTIADFVSDLRAPTPSAAAELALPDKSILNKQINDLQFALSLSLKKKISLLRSVLQQMKSRLKSPDRYVYDLRLKIDDLESRMDFFVSKMLEHDRDKLSWLCDSLAANTPMKTIAENRNTIIGLKEKLTREMDILTNQKNAMVHELSNRLASVNPQTVLKRGYSIARKIPENIVLTDAKQVTKNDSIEILLSNGRLITRVEKANG